MSFDPQPFNFLEALATWGIVAGILFAVIALVALIASLVLNGAAGISTFWTQSKKLAGDAIRISPRRIWALSMLTFRESIRRKVLAIFIVFAILFMFAGWFLSSNSELAAQQVEVHVSFVLRTISLLSIVVMVLLACWSLPADIKARSLHTVVTKPVPRHEVFLGRIIGFSLVGSLVVAVMGTVGYFWIVRQVPPKSHSHLTCRVPVYGDLQFLDANGIPTNKGINVGDVWDFRSYIGGQTKAAAIWTFTDVSKNWLVPARNYRTGEVLVDNETGDPQQAIRLETNFEVFRTYKGDQKRGVRCEVRLVKNLRERSARALAPVEEFRQVKSETENSNFDAVGNELKTNANGLRYGDLKFTARHHRAIEKGYEDFAVLMQAFRDQGNESAFIPEMVAAARQCSTAAKNRSEADLADGLEQLAQLFRDNNAELQTLLVDMVSRAREFNVQEYRARVDVYLPEKLRYQVNGVGNEKDGDLFEDFIHNGKLAVHVVCLDRNQYLGMARPDLFVRLPNRHFAVGYGKAIFGVWLAMLLVVILGVTASCFLKGPVATLLVVVLIILGGAWRPFMQKVVEGKLDSAGALESFYRIIHHHNPRVDISDNRGYGVIKNVDTSLMYVLKGANGIIPDLNNFRMYPYVAKGFDVPWSTDSGLLPALLTTFGFFIPCLFLGYLSLASRELEDK